jgi:hypothetical protein
MDLNHDIHLAATAKVYFCCLLALDKAQSTIVQTAFMSKLCYLIELAVTQSFEKSKFL